MSGNTSQFLGGYDVAPAEGIGSVSSTFRLPKKVTCPDASNLEWLTLGEWANNDVGSGYQAGGATDAVAAGGVQCQEGTPVFVITALVASSGEFDDYTDINAGDQIQTRIAELPTGQVAATVIDLTSGQEETASGATTGGVTQVYEGAVPDVVDSLDIPKISTVTFTNSQVNGLDLSQADPTAEDLAESGKVQIVPSKLPAKPTTGFTLTEKSTK